MGEARAGSVVAAERGPDWRRRTLGSSAGSGARLRRLPVGINEAKRAAAGSYVRFRVFSERWPYGWDAYGFVLSNTVADHGAIVLWEFNRKTYTIPWRYFVNGLVFVHEEKKRDG